MSARKSDCQISQIVKRLVAADRLDGQKAPIIENRAAGQDDAVVAERLRHLEHRKPLVGKRLSIHADGYFAADPAAHVRGEHAVDVGYRRQKGLGDDALNIGKVAVAHDAQLQNGERVRVEPRHDRIANAFREGDAAQVGIDGGFDLRHVDPELEHADNQRAVLGGHRLNALHPGNVLNRALDRLRHVPRDRLRVGGRIEGGDGDEGKLNLRKKLHRQLPIGENAGREYQNYRQKRNRALAKRKRDDESHGRYGAPRQRLVSAGTRGR